MAEWTYERQANAYGKGTLAAKLDAHGKLAYECPTSARDEARLVVKQACGEAAYECPAIINDKATLEWV